MKTSCNDTPHFRYEADLIKKVYSNDQQSMPIRYILGLTNDCNLHCSFCFLNKPEPEKEMTLNDWFNVADQIPEGSRVILFGGEPLFYKSFNEIYLYIVKKFDCTIVTNGTLLTENKIELLLSQEKLLDIAVSIDIVGNGNRGFTKKQWQRLVASIKLYKKMASQLGRSAKLGVSAVLLDETADGLFELHQYAREELACDYITYCTLNGTSLQLSDTMINDFDELQKTEDAPLYEKWDTIQEQFALMRKYDQERGLQTYLRPKLLEFSGEAPLDTLKILNKPQFSSSSYGPCTMPWSDCRIYSDGSVTSCLAYPFGNFKETPNLKAILQSGRAIKFKNAVKEGFFPQCNRCVFLYDKEFC